MAFEWTDRIDGEDAVLAEDVNALARGIQGNEESINSANAAQEITNAEVQELKNKQELQKTELTAHQKRIENIESALYPDIVTPVTDDSVAHIKDVPLNALPYAEVIEVGGMTYKEDDALRSAPVTAIEIVGENLLDPNSGHWAKTSDQTSLEFKSNGIKLISGMASSQSWGRVYLYIGETQAFVGKSLTLKADYATSVQGDTAKSTIGFSTSDTLYGYGAWPNSSELLDIKAEPVTQMSVLIPEGQRKYLYAIFYFGYGCPLTETDWTEYTNIQVKIGSTVAQYSPFTKTVFSIPEAVQALDGYGWGVSVACYNYIDFEKKQFVQKVGKDESGEPFELETPVITDISHLLSDDNYIPVEGGGIITMVNEHGYAVPSTIEYTVKGASAQ